MSGRYIDADALYEKTAEREAQALHMVELHINDEDKTEWKRWSFILKERSAFKFDIADSPTADVVEVVRCKDCMFNHWHETPHGEKYHICNLNKLSFSEHADFFCKYGERREDDKGRNTTSI